MKPKKWVVIYSGSLPSWASKSDRWHWVFVSLRWQVVLHRLGQAVEDTFDEVTGGVLR